MNLYEAIQKNMVNSPESIAITHNEENLTYHQLALYTNAAEHLISANDIKPGDTAIIYMKNSIAMIVAILACLKSGIVVLPVDENQLPRKLDEIYLKSGAKIILCDKLSSYKLNPEKLCILDISTVTFNSSLYDSIEYSTHIITNENAYCIFTSGTSNEPKGVLLTHNGIFNHIKAKISDLSLDKTMKTCLSMNIGFVASIWIVLTPLIIGAHLYIYDKNIMDNPLNLYKSIHADKLTVISLIPQYIRLLTKFLFQHEKTVSPGELKVVISTGDKLTPDIVREFYSLFHIPLMNAYGQSECSDDTFHYRIPFDFDEQIVPIGKPIAGCQPYIFDENMQESEIGQRGELYISGTCLSNGYIDDRNSYRFVRHPDNGVQLFKTCDIISRNLEGVYFYHGRTDNQIKINGYKIIPEEIEEKIKQCPNVRECVVGLVERNNAPFLAALISPLSNIPLEYNDIKNFLREQLPPPMIPNKLIQMDDMPITANGKINRAEIQKHMNMLYDYDNDLQNYIDDMTEQRRLIFELILDDLNGLIHKKSQLYENIDNIGVDSLMFIKLVVDLEEKYNITFDDDKLSLISYKNLNEFFEYVLKMSEVIKST